MHGPSGEFPGLEAKDSIYRVARGGNHGWPLWCGVGPAPFIAPVVYYPGETVPPGGACFYRGSLLVTSLAAEDVRRYSFDAGGRVTYRALVHGALWAAAGHQRGTRWGAVSDDLE
jgi:glucose/arabinose dehydrogenase